MASSENHATFMPDVIERFPIVLGREFCGEVIDVAPDLMYTFPVGSKVVGYMKPWQQGALTEALFVPVSQCAHLPSNLSGTVKVRNFFDKGTIFRNREFLAGHF